MRCTLKEYDFLYLAHARREEREWDRTRHLMASIMNTVSTKPIQPTKVMTLTLTDMGDTIPIVRTDVEAYKILERFRNGSTKIRS